MIRSIRNLSQAQRLMLRALVLAAVVALIAWSVVLYAQRDDSSAEITRYAVVALVELS